MPRPRKPTNILILNGADKKNPKRLKEREGEPVNVNPIGDVPEELNEAEKRCWETITSSAIPGVLGQADRIAVMIASKLMARFVSGDAKGFEITQLIRLLSQFGMTPADRSRISIPTVKPRNPFAED